MNAWDATTYEGKETILRVVREEAARLTGLEGRPGAWEAPTACEKWAVRDVVGHLVDTTEGYFGAFEAARAGAAASPYGLTGMHERAGQQATRFRGLSQREMHGLSGDAADLLVPFMFVLWQSTIRQDADLTPFRLGITVTGRNAGSLVLTTFGRSNAGTVRGGQPPVPGRALPATVRPAGEPRDRARSAAG